MNPINVASAGLLLLASLFGGTTSVLAQTEGWLKGPGVNAGKASTVVPTNCVEGSDGSIAAFHAIGRNNGACLASIDTWAFQPAFRLGKNRSGSTKERGQ